VTAHTGLGLIGSDIDPCQLVAEDATVAVEYLEVKQSVGWHFDEERTVRGKRGRAEYPGECPAVILPDLV
jgi:hypothetical protein